MNSIVLQWVCYFCFDRQLTWLDMNCELFFWVVVPVSIQIFCLSCAASLFYICVVQQSARDWARKNLGISSDSFPSGIPHRSSATMVTWHQFSSSFSHGDLCFPPGYTQPQAKSSNIDEFATLFYIVLSSELVTTPSKWVCSFHTPVPSGSCFF